MEENQVKTLNKLIYNYSKSVQAGWHLTAPDIEDAMNTVYERNEIHTLIEKLSTNDIAFDTKVLETIDKVWQEQILEYIHAGEVIKPFYPQPDEPLNKWWMHIESLDTLSEKNLSTI